MMIYDIDEGIRGFIEAWNLRIKVPKNGTPVWVKPNIEVNPLGEFTAVNFDPEIRILSGISIDKVYPSSINTVKRDSPTDSSKIQILTQHCNHYSYGYQIEHITRDPIIDGWLKTEFLKRFDKINSFAINVSGGSSYYIDLIWERSVPLNLDEFYATGYRFVARFELAHVELTEKTLNTQIVINVNPKSTYTPSEWQTNISS